jgi:pimeloyl-ACP methyl ester carboxylesterase
METDFNLTRRARNLVALAALLLSMSAGCALQRSRWNPPSAASVDGILVDSPEYLAPAEASYTAGAAAEVVGDPACIDHYYAAAVGSWPYHVASAANPEERANELYRSSVECLVASAHRFCRFDPNRGITLTSGRIVPIAYRSFLWSPADFNHFLPVGPYTSQHLDTRYVAGGVGVQYVVLTDNRLRRPFTRRGQPFAATAVLAPSGPVEVNAPESCFALTLYDPLRTCTTETGLPLARDLTAPLAYSNALEGRTAIEDFIRPTRDVGDEGIHMREPFQPGKIPVLFIHGLASDPQTWSQLEANLLADPAFVARFQIWLFRYDTGEPFLTSAALLRRNLAAIRQTYDPMRCDPNLSQMVLVGHSMGGLLAKLQVTTSGNTLWQAAARRPLAAIVTDQATRAGLARAFYFQPSPDVTRVVFIATPHRGSSDATRFVGRISSALVQDPPQWRARHDQLIRDNPGVFSEEMSRGIPTSVDLLEPDSQILDATTRLCFRPDVHLHTILGNWEWAATEEPSDGVVPVASARLYGSETELDLNARHTQLQSRPETTREIKAILARHAATVACLGETPNY